MPSSFASVNDLARDDRQQFVPVISYDHAANNVPAAATPASALPSGAAIQNTNPLSISTTSSKANSLIKPDSVIRSITVAQDTIPPTGSISINSGATYATSRTVTLNLRAKDSGSGVVAMSFSTDGKNWTAKESYRTSKKLVLPEGDGSKTVFVKYFDRAGNASQVYSDTIILDTLPPSGTVTVNGGAQFINQTAVTLNLSAADAGSGLNKMRFSTNGTTWGATEAYAAKKAWTFSSGDGAKKVYVQFQDKTGKWSAVASVSVALDTVKPTGTITINNGEAYSNSTAIILDLSAADSLSGISAMSFSTDNVNWSASEAYATSKNYALPTGDGPKTVYVKYFDVAGNVSLVYSKSIILDTLPPTGTITVNNGAQFITQTAVTLDLSAADAGSGLDKMSFSSDNVTWTAAEAYAATRSWTVSSGDGNKTVYVKFSDKAGEWSAPVFVQVFLDTTAPTGTIQINQNAAYTPSSMVTLNLYYIWDIGSGVDQMRFSADGGANWSAWEAFSASRSFTLSEGTGMRQVQCQLRDRAGLVSEVFSDAIRVGEPPAWIPAASNSNFALRLNPTENGFSYIEYKNLTTGSEAQVPFPVYGGVQDFDMSGDGTTVSFHLPGSDWLYSYRPRTSLDLLSSYSSFTMSNADVFLQFLTQIKSVWTGVYQVSVTAFRSAGGNVSSTVLFSEMGISSWPNFAPRAISSDVVTAVYERFYSGQAVPELYVLHGGSVTAFPVTGYEDFRFTDFPDLGEVIEVLYADAPSEYYDPATLERLYPSQGWIPATSNANYAFRLTQEGNVSRLELKYITDGGITVLYSGTGNVSDTFDVTPDGRTVIYSADGITYLQRVGNPSEKVGHEGDLKLIQYQPSYVMLTTEIRYPSGTVFHRTFGVRVHTPTFEYVSSFYTTLITAGTGFYRNDDLGIAVQVEYYPGTGQYKALIHNRWGGSVFSWSNPLIVDLDHETGISGGMFTLVDVVASPSGEKVLSIGLDSPTFNRTYLINNFTRLAPKIVPFDGAATAVTYQGHDAVYAARDNDGSMRNVRVNLETLQVVPELPAIELVQPVITQVPNPINQFTLKFDQAMRGVRYEVQFTTSLTSEDWQTADSIVATNYGEVSWQDPVSDRGNTVFYRVVAKEITTAADLLTQINMLYLDSEFGLVESTHEYPLEGWLQRRITQPSNFGFYANLLATIAAGDLVTATISKAEAVRRLDVMMTQLLADQQRLGHLGLLPWLGFYNGDWQRMDDLYGRQVSFEDNTNMTAGLAVAYGALLDGSLSGNSTVHGNGGILQKIDAFIENQRIGYAEMYNDENQTFARTMVIADNHLEGTVDLFGAESMGPLLFLILQYGDEFLPSAYAKLHFSTSSYTMQDGSTRTVVEPFSGAFQMYWPALFMPEADEPDLRAMLETYTDVQLDYANRNNQPGFLSASYDVGSYDLLSRYVGAFSWAGDAVSGVRDGDGSFHVTSPSSQGIGVYFTDDSKFVFEGSTMQLRYSSQTSVPNARLEFKQMIDGVLQVVHVENLSLENTGGEVRTLTLTLPENGTLGDLKEVIFAVSEGSGPLDLTFHRIDIDRIQYNFSLGINEIAMNGVMETTPSTYNLGAAYMFRPEGVEALLQRLINEHPELITNHGLWEGINMTSGKVVKEQVFNNVVSFTLGMAGTGGSSMARYLEHKGLTPKLESIWDPQVPVSLTSGTSGNFEWNGFKGTAWHIPESVRASGRELSITYQSSTPITGVKLELKHAGSNDPAYSVQFDLPATGSGPGEHVITIPESYLYWYIADAVVLFPEAQGYPNAKITGMTLTPANDTVPPVVVLDAGTPSLINAKMLTVSYAVDGVSKTKLFTDLAEGLNTLSITEEDLAGNTTTVTHQVTVDTIAPVVVLDPGTLTWIASSSMVVYYTLDGALKQKTFTDLVVGVNQLAISEIDPAGNQTTVNFSVSRPQGTDFLKGQIATFALNGGNAIATLDSGVLHVTSSNFKGVGVAAIMPSTSVNVRQVQISYSSLTPVPNARIEYKARDASGNLIIVKTQYLNLQNTGGIVKTVTTDLIFSGYPAIDEIVFVTDGAGTSTLDMKIYGFAGF